MRSPLRMTLVIGLCLGGPAVAATADKAAPGKQVRPAARAVSGAKAPKPEAKAKAAETGDEQAKRAQAQAEAKQREWDRKMKQLTRSICSGC